MKKIILIGLISSMVLSCKKKESCELNDTGSVSVFHSYPDSYHIYIDDKYVGYAIKGNTTIFDKIDVGIYSLKAINDNDNSDVIYETVTVDQCFQTDVILYE